MIKNKTLLYGIIVIIVIVVAGVVWSLSNREATIAAISNFEECAEAGYPVLQTAPRQCKTPDGRTFLEGSVATVFLPNTSCEGAEDCMLINKDLEYSCCWVGACDPIDYSLEKWIAVNKAWFDEGRLTSCPATQECGPAPLCVIQAVNVDFTAQCGVDQVCQKVPK